MNLLKKFFFLDFSSKLIQNVGLYFSELEKYYDYFFIDLTSIKSSKQRKLAAVMPFQSCDGGGSSSSGKISLIFSRE